MSPDVTGEQSLWTTLQQRILASRFLTISLLLHLLVVAFFGTKVLFSKYVEPPDFAAEGEGFLSSNAEIAVPAPENSLNSQTPTFTATAPQPMVSALSAITTTNPAVQNFAMNAVPAAAPVISTAVVEKIAAQPVKASGLVSNTLPPALASRGIDRRATALRENGGKEKSEQAVVKALPWLKSVQNKDGSWGRRSRGTMTGLALLAFLGHGETQNSPEFGKTVGAAVDAILKEGMRWQGHLAFVGNGWGRGSDGVTQHAIATYALSEAYAMTRDPRIVPVLKQAVGYIIAGQRPDGGWAYGYNLDPAPEPPGRGKTSPAVARSDTATSVWQVQALRAAELTEIPIDRLREAMANALKNFDRVFDSKTGDFGYRELDDNKDIKVPALSVTGAAVLAVSLTTDKKADRMIREGLKSIVHSPKVDYYAADANMYNWYYNTMACFMTRDKWGTWNQSFQDEIANNQGPDGSWPPNGGTGSGNMNDTGIDAQVYRTALSTLMLEVYYLYNPNVR